MIETGVYFGHIHSFYDLNLILSSVDIEPAKPKTTYINITGGDGSIDLTEAHGEVKFNDRDCKFTFTVNPSESLTFEAKKSQIYNALNGLQCQITLDKDSGYYFIGRCSVDNYKQDKNLLQFTVTAQVRPYKYKKRETVAVFALTSTEQTITLTNGRKSVVPTITCSEGAVVEYKGSTYTLGAGTVKILDIQLTEGINTLKTSGSGTITFTYQEGEL